MATENQKDQTVFQIKFEGFSLSPEQEQAVSAALRSAALAEIAKFDFRDPIEVRSFGGPGVLPGIEAKVRP